MRPERIVLVAGTGTEIGKTWVSARLLTGLRQAGATVAARKLAQSFDPGDDPGGLDAAVLGRASGEPPEVVCPPDRWYEVAMAPPMAAARLGRPPFTVAHLLGELSWPAAPVDVGIVETAGGVRSPQADDGDVTTLREALNPDLVVLVADAGLGTINSVRLSVGVFSGRPLVVLNRYDGSNDLHVSNRTWLTERDGIHLVALPDEEATLLALVRR
ncbi:MAG TPA: dethiobiotin synthase [Acidimicrobiales bacterium]|nr:dethiobiotin synthase [Acidimicrobiales bacterium]